MSASLVEEHWEEVWTRVDVAQTSWYQLDAQPSLGLVRNYSDPAEPVLDIGGGMSALAMGLSRAGYTDVTVVDIAHQAIRRMTEQIVAAGIHGVTAVQGDARTVAVDRPVAVWHDRAVFHFLTDAQSRRDYSARAAAAVRPGGHLIVGAFAPDGPTQCSGLPVRRYDGQGLAAEFATGFQLVDVIAHPHVTPAGYPQPFVFAVLRRG